MTADLRAWRCWHCDSANTLVEGAAAGDRRRPVLQVEHEPGCPDFAEEPEAAEYVVVDGGVARAGDVGA